MGWKVALQIVTSDMPLRVATGPIAVCIYCMSAIEMRMYKVLQDYTKIIGIVDNEDCYKELQPSP